MAVIDLVPDRVDYNYGFGHLELLTRPIPRAWWPDKVYPQSEAHTPLLREGALSTTVVPTSRKVLLMGPSFTFVGHWYSVGGALGLLFGGVLTGVMFRMFRSIYDRDSSNEGNLLLFSTFIGVGSITCRSRMGQSCSH
jgi:hypothetical protein